MQSKNTDIVIIGAGISGCILALALAPYYSVVLVDSADEPSNVMGGSLPPGGIRVLERLGLLSALNIKASDRHIANQKTVTYWGSDQPRVVESFEPGAALSRTELSRANREANVNPFASDVSWHIDRQFLAKRLRETAMAMGIECCWPAVTGNAEFEDERWHIDVLPATSSGPGRSNSQMQHRQSESNERHQQASVSATRQYSARFVVDASGRDSHFSVRRGAHRLQTDKLVSVELMFDRAQQRAVTSIHATANGWWHCAPFPKKPIGQAHKSSQSSARILSFQTDADLFDESQFNSLSYWIEQILNTPSMAQEIDKIDLKSLCHHSFKPAFSSRLMGQSGSRWLAVGEAAMSLDPVSVQGMFHVMAGAMYLRDLLTRYGIESEMSCSCITFELHRQLERTWQHYQSCQQYYYAQETRWRHSPFWQRRQA